MHSITQKALVSKEPTNLGEPLLPSEKHALVRRHVWKYQKRDMYWYDPDVGRIILPDGTGKNLDSRMTLYELLERIRAHQKLTNEKAKAAVLMLRAGRSVRHRPSRDWFSVPAAWEVKNFRWKSLQVEYEREGFTVHLHSTGDYWQEEASVHRTREAYHALEAGIAREFGLESYHLRPTPASTGRDLLEITLPHNQAYARLPDEIVDLVAGNLCHQGRMEHFKPICETLENGVYVLDGRWMYAGCVSHLPTGLCYRDEQNEFLGTVTRNGHMVPTVQAFYYVTFQVPDHWQHIGLLKAPTFDRNENAFYPREPGATFTNWITAAELALAIEYGWPVQIHERLLWPFPLTDPLATLRKKLVGLREEVENDKLLKGATRAILLHTIGSFRQRYTFVDRFTPTSELPLPAGTRIDKIGPTTIKGMRWREAIPLVGREQFNHPEWCATVWGRARARLAAFALRLPFEDIVSLRTDCVWSASLPDWLAQEDNGKPGAFRCKDYIEGAWHWPETAARMRAYVIKYNLSQGESIEEELAIGEEEPVSEME